MPLFALVLLASCGDGGPSVSAPGDGGSTGDDGGSDTTAWQVLADDCTAPSSAYTDPFVLRGSVKNGQDEPGGWFTEILDVSLIPDENRVVTAGQGGVVVFDVDGDAPVTRGHVGVGAASQVRFYHVLAAEPGLAWATHRDIGLDAIDLSDPDTLLSISRTEGRGFEGLARDGDRLYVASTRGELAVFDVSDPREPVQLGWVDGLGRAWDVAVLGGVLYVADGELGVDVLNLDDPDEPQLVTTVASAGMPVRLAGADGVLYVASGAGGVEVFDLSDPLDPVAASALDPGGSALDVAVGDGSLGVTTQEAVVLYDTGRAGVGSSLAPQPFAYQETEQFAMALDGAGGLWAVGDWNILGLWELGTELAPAIDLSVGTVAFLDGAGTATVEVLNRGAAALSLSGIAVPDGVEARVESSELGPGERAVLELTWDGLTALESTVCIASDDPSQPQVELEVVAAKDGEGRALGQQAPDFALVDLDGTTHRLSEQLGHPVVLAYFATW